MKTSVIVLVLVGAIAAGGWYVWRARNATAAAATNPSTDTAQVLVGSIVSGVTSPGQVMSNLDVDIKCRASGEVVKLPFDISDKVSKGDLLVELDPTEQLRSVARATVALAESRARVAQAAQNVLVAEQTLVVARKRAQSTLESAQVRAANARARADRQRELAAQNLGSKEEYETAQTEAAQADAELRAAQIQFDDLKTQELALEVKRQDVKLADAQRQDDQLLLDTSNLLLSYTKVTAPMDGVVSALNIQKGTIISSAISNVGGGTTVITLSDLSRIYVLATVDESNIGQVKVGQEATITVDAFRGQQFTGNVVRIAAKGVNVSNVVTFEVKIEVTSENKNLLKPLMTANVQIIQDRHDNVLLVPTRAIQRQDNQIVAMVLNPADNTAAARPVKVGMMNGENYEVLSGLKEGETVQLAKSDADQSRWRGGRGPNLFGGAGGAGGGGGGAGGGTRRR